MDKEVMDFLGNLFLYASKGQKQLEEMAELTRQAFTRFMEVSASFRKICEVEPFEPENTDYFQMWSKMGDMCQRSFIDGCSKVWGMSVVSSEHLHLISKYEELKERIASQEETIRHLRLLLDEARRESLIQAAQQRHRESKSETEGQWNNRPHSSHATI